MSGTGNQMYEYDYDYEIFSILSSTQQGPVVRTPVSANPGLNFNPGFLFLLSRALSRIVFSVLFIVSSHQIVGKEN